MAKFRSFLKVLETRKAFAWFEETILINRCFELHGSRQQYIDRLRRLSFPWTSAAFFDQF